MSESAFDEATVRLFSAEMYGGDLFLSLGNAYLSLPAWALALLAVPFLIRGVRSRVAVAR